MVRRDSCQAAFCIIDASLIKLPFARRIVGMTMNGGLLRRSLVASNKLSATGEECVNMDYTRKLSVNSIKIEISCLVTDVMKSHLLDLSTLLHNFDY